MADHFNCLTYAVGRWWKEGGYVVLLKSPRWKGIHALYSKNLLTFFEYIPKRPRLSPWLIQVLRFDGYVKEWRPRRADRRQAASPVTTDRRQP
jgi:hypothetical protein